MFLFMKYCVKSSELTELTLKVDMVNTKSIKLTS
jgi:hypothetical protein